MRNVGIMKTDFRGYPVEGSIVCMHVEYIATAGAAISEGGI